jgi:hypothetical protein
MRIMLLLAMFLCGSYSLHAGQFLLTGSGTATIDGVLNTLEWSGAGRADFPVNLDGGGTANGTLYVMNDSVNLYLALNYSGANIRNSLVFEFSNDNSGFHKNGDDVIVLNGINSFLGYFDDFRTNLPPCPVSAPGACGFEDSAFGGTVDGGGAFLTSGTSTVFEIFRPLNSGDTGHDFAVGPGQTIGFSMDLFGETVATHPGIFQNFGGAITIQPTPEPATLLLVGASAALLMRRGRRLCNWRPCGRPD